MRPDLPCRKPTAPSGRRALLGLLLSLQCVAVVAAELPAAAPQGGAGVEVHALGGSAPATVASAPVGQLAARECGPAYRYKALVATFPVLSPVQLSDLPRFPQMLQAQLARRLEASGHFLAQISSNEAAYAIAPGQAEGQWDPQWIRELARRHGVQFVVGGVLRDAGAEGERYALSHGDDIRPGERKMQFDFPFLDFFRPGIKATPLARRFEIDVLVFDGISGSFLGQRRLAGKVSGSMFNGAEIVSDPTVDADTQRFFASDFGRLVNAKLDEAVQGVGGDIACTPFAARVVQLGVGQVYLDAGSRSRLAVGDRLQVFHLQPGAAPLLAQGRSAELGMPRMVVGTLVLRQVQPLFAMAEPEGQFALEVGDYVSTLIPARNPLQSRP